MAWFMQISVKLDEDNNILMYEYANTWYPVCNTNWDSSMSDQACQHMGYGIASQTTSIPSTLGDQHFQFTGGFTLSSLQST